jgi:hypothetical protein
VRAFRFSLIIAGKPDFTDEEVDALFEAVCDDGTPGSSCGVASIIFTREANSLVGAIKSAMADVEKAGLKVSEVSIDAEDFERLGP